jgi:hypothetical protein
MIRVLWLVNEFLSGHFFGTDSRFFLNPPLHVLKEIHEKNIHRALDKERQF